MKDITRGRRAANSPAIGATYRRISTLCAGGLPSAGRLKVHLRSWLWVPLLTIFAVPVHAAPVTYEFTGMHGSDVLHGLIVYPEDLGNIFANLDQTWDVNDADTYGGQFGDILDYITPGQELSATLGVHSFAMAVNSTFTVDFNNGPDGWFFGPTGTPTGLGLSIWGLDLLNVGEGGFAQPQAMFNMPTPDGTVRVRVQSITAVPEAPTWLLGSLGAIALALVRARRLLR
jgi:hypothetical protein